MKKKIQRKLSSKSNDSNDDSSNRWDKKSHNDTIMVNKFFDQNTVLTGSHDKSLKFWDLRSSLFSPELIFQVIKL